MSTVRPSINSFKPTPLRGVGSIQVLGPMMGVPAMKRRSRGAARLMRVRLQSGLGTSLRALSGSRAEDASPDPRVRLSVVGPTADGISARNQVLA